MSCYAPLGYDELSDLRKRMKKHKRVILSLLFAGSFLLSWAALCGFSVRQVRSGVIANGIEVGGMRLDEAVQAVREELARNLPPLTIVTPQRRVRIEYPELSFTDDAEDALKRAKRGESIRIEAKRQWANAELRLQQLCDESAYDATDAEVRFRPSGFTYVKGKRGRVANYAASLDRVLKALEEDKTEAALVTYPCEPALTLKMLKERTRLLASYTTRFDASNTARTHNIRLAAKKLAGTTLLPHAEFSFNERVGERTAENGFQESVVIFDGEFVKGVGGGVCQVSTTLFNAALRSGLTISESRNHSLSVSYVQPSLDAMVSEYSDLKFINPYDTPVYINARVNGGSITVDCYGLPDGRRYQTESVILYRLAPPPDEVVEGPEDKVLRAAKEGIASESYLLVYDQKGTLLSRTLIRRDSYALVRGKRQVAPPKEEGEEPSGESAPQ